MSVGFTAVHNRIEALTLGVHLANPRIYGISENGSQQFTSNKGQRAVTKGLLQLLSSPTELRNILQNASNLGLNGFNNGRLNAKVRPQKPEDRELIRSDQRQQNRTVDNDQLGIVVWPGWRTHAGIGSAMRPPNLSAKEYRSIISNSAAFATLISPKFNVSMTCLT